MVKYSNLNPNALGIASAAVTTICWLFMFAGYGMGLQYGIMHYGYGMMAFWMLPIVLLVGYAAGWLIATIYNYVISK